MSTLFPWKFLREGAHLLAYGIIGGILVKNFASFLGIEYFTALLPTIGGVSNIAQKKFDIFQELGATPTLAIFLTNLVSILVIIGYPYLGITFGLKDRSIYTKFFPKILIFSVGFLSIGLLFPPISRPVMFFLFAMYLIPHGVLELFSILLSYSVPREWSEDLYIPWKRVGLAILLLLFSAFIETHYSISFATFIMNILI